MTIEEIAELKAQIARLTELLAAGASASAPCPASYSVDEAAKLLGRSPYTVREWCREGQCNAFKLRGWRHGPIDLQVPRFLSRNGSLEPAQSDLISPGSSPTSPR
ncbi:MAG TPA: helix-turn-helix domain-containing protein [Isosphaeraceae bacterium]